MASIPLPTIILQIEYATTPFAVLGISDQATIFEARDQYLTLALKIHPDKAPNDDQRELYTSLFQKLQIAHDQLLSGHFSQDEDDKVAAPKRLPETLASLHARNVAFREALRDERERAVSAKHEADARKAARLAVLKGKTERKEAQAQVLEHMAKKQVSKDEQRQFRVLTVEESRAKVAAEQVPDAAASEPTLSSSKTPSGSTPTDAGVVPGAAEERDIHPEHHSPAVATHLPSAEIAASYDGVQNWLDPCEEPSWEELEDRLEAQDATLAETNEDKQKAAWKASKNFVKPKAPLRKAPTGSAVDMWDCGLDEHLVSEVAIKDRWDQKLLGGGREGSVSFSQKKERENNGAARIQKRCLALNEDAINLMKPMLTGSKNQTFSGLVQEKLEWDAFVGTERKGEARTDRVLMVMMDEDVREQYLLEDGELLGEQKIGLIEYATWEE